MPLGARFYEFGNGCVRVGCECRLLFLNGKANVAELCRRIDARRVEALLYGAKPLVESMVARQPRRESATPCKPLLVVEPDGIALVRKLDFTLLMFWFSFGKDLGFAPTAYPLSDAVIARRLRGSL